METHDNSNVVSEMADAMLQFGEGCTRDDLALRFSDEDLDRYGAEARRQANQRAVFQRRARVAARAA